MRAAVDVDVFARDIAGFFRRKENNRAGNFKDFADTFHGNFFGELDVVFFGAVHVFANVGVNRAGAHAVDGNSVFGDFAGKIFAETEERRFRRAVMCTAENAAAAFCRHAGQADDTAVFGFLHDFDDGFRDKESAEHVDGKDAFHVVERHVVHGDALSNARVVDQNVNFAVFVFDVFDEFVDGFFIGNVQNETVGFVARSFNFGNGVFAALFVHVGDNDVRASFGEHVGNAATDTAFGTGTCDDNNLVFKIKHDNYLHKINVEFGMRNAGQREVNSQFLISHS